MTRDPETTNVVRLESEPARLWREFLEARERAWNSRDLCDGVASGRAYAAFLEAFVAPDLRSTGRADR